jgi:hypothetical protein
VGLREKKGEGDRPTAGWVLPRYHCVHRTRAHPVLVAVTKDMRRWVSYHDLSYLLVYLLLMLSLSFCVCVCVCVHLIQQ